MVELQWKYLSRLGFNAGNLGRKHSMHIFIMNFFLCVCVCKLLEIRSINMMIKMHNFAKLKHHIVKELHDWAR